MAAWGGMPVSKLELAHVKSAVLAQHVVQWCFCGPRPTSMPQRTPDVPCTPAMPHPSSGAHDAVTDIQD